MKKKAIFRAITQIMNVTDDDEAAHALEDELRTAFIKSVGARNDALGERARLVLSTSKLDFRRCC